MPTKDEFAQQMKDLVANDISWSKLTRDDLVALTQFFSNPKLVVMTFSEQLNDAERSEMVNYLQSHAPTIPQVGSVVPPAGSNMPTVDQVLHNRPVIRAILQNITGGARL